jgi:hypothetical protein
MKRFLCCLVMLVAMESAFAQSGVRYFWDGYKLGFNSIIRNEDTGKREKIATILATSQDANSHLPHTWCGNGALQLGCHA